MITSLALAFFGGSGLNYFLTFSYQGIVNTGPRVSLHPPGCCPLSSSSVRYGSFAWTAFFSCSLTNELYRGTKVSFVRYVNGLFL